MTRINFGYNNEITVKENGDEIKNLINVNTPNHFITLTRENGGLVEINPKTINYYYELIIS